MTHSECPVGFNFSTIESGKIASFVPALQNKKRTKGLTQDAKKVRKYYQAFEWLALLMAARRRQDDGGQELDNPGIPAGYTYLGQLIAHDLTLSLRPLSAGPAGNLNRHEKNARTPVLDLDTVYGGGPLVSPHLYERAPKKDKPANRTKFKIGWTRPAPSFGQEATQRDLPRTEIDNLYLTAANGELISKKPLETVICDVRNEDNLILSQLMVLIYRIHNAFVDQFDASVYSPPEVFEAARWLTARAYRGVIKHDFLARLLDADVCKSYRTKRKLGDFQFSAKLFSKDVEGALPIEFTMGAMRAGHAMVRNNYRFPTGVPTKDNISLRKLLKFRPDYEFEAKTAGYMTGGEPLPLKEIWAVKDWGRFFPDQSSNDYEPSKKIAAAVATELVDDSNKRFPSSDDRSNAPVKLGGLVFRDLARGFQNALPDGLQLARRMGIQTVSAGQLKQEILEKYKDTFGSEFSASEVEAICELLASEPPLFFFILAEAELTGRDPGAKLGPLGSTIMAEVVYATLILGHNRDGPQPHIVKALPADRRRKLKSFKTMSALIKWVEDAAPMKVDHAVTLA